MSDRIYEPRSFVLRRSRDGSRYTLTYGAAGWIRFPQDELDSLHQLLGKEIADASE